jgi:translation initiation factor 4G
VDDREKTKRKIKVTLNKLSPSNIEKLQPELLSLGKESREALYYLVETLFDKSWAEVKYTPMYAHLCKYLKQEFEGYLFDGESPSKKKSNWFRYILLNCVQTAFDNAPVVPQNSHEPEIHLHLAKKKTHGNIRFIGELLKVKIVTAKIIQGIVEVLINLDHKSEAHEIDEDKLEIACVLISTAGHVFEKKNLKNETDKIFGYLNEILQNNGSISSKLKFSIMV